MLEVWKEFIEGLTGEGKCLVRFLVGIVYVILLLGGEIFRKTSRCCRMKFAS